MLDWYRRRVIARRGFTVLLVYLKGPTSLPPVRLCGTLKYIHRTKYILHVSFII